MNCTDNLKLSSHLSLIIQNEKRETPFPFCSEKKLRSAMYSDTVNTQLRRLGNDPEITMGYDECSIILSFVDIDEYTMDKGRMKLIEDAEKYGETSLIKAMHALMTLCIDHNYCPKVMSKYSIMFKRIAKCIRDHGQFWGSRELVIDRFIEYYNTMHSGDSKRNDMVLDDLNRKSVLTSSSSVIFFDNPQLRLWAETLHYKIPLDWKQEEMYKFAADKMINLEKYRSPTPKVKSFAKISWEISFYDKEGNARSAVEIRKDRRAAIKNARLLGTPEEIELMENLITSPRKSLSNTQIPSDIAPLPTESQLKARQIPNSFCGGNYLLIIKKFSGFINKMGQDPEISALNNIEKHMVLECELQRMKFLSYGIEGIRYTLFLRDQYAKYLRLCTPRNRYSSLECVRWLRENEGTKTIFDADIIWSDELTEKVCEQYLDIFPQMKHWSSSPG